MMKRCRDGDAHDISAMANCLMLLSSAAAEGDSYRVFTCKTCNRQFPSFQALGGHRASHKKPRLTAAGDPPSPPKPKIHECSICGMEFPLGQSLGGHMRRHRAVISDHNHHQPPPVVKKTNSGRIFCLDLNLTPLENQYYLNIASSHIYVDL